MTAEATCKSVQLSGNITFKTIWAGADDPQKLSDMIARCNIVFATHLVYEYIVKIAGHQKNIIKIDSSISDSNIKIIQERLASTSIK